MQHTSPAMSSTNNAQDNGESMDTDELLQGHLELWHHALGFIKSAALLCAMELGIPDAILRCGGAATLDDLVTVTKVPPSNVPFLRRLMRALTATRIFAVRHRRPSGEGESTVDEPAASIPVYELTAASRLLVTVTGVEGGSSFGLFPSIKSLIKPANVSAILGMHDRMKDESASTMSVFKDVWKMVEDNPTVRTRFHDAMDADTSLIMHAVLKDHAAIFQGLASLVDVGGGRGTAASAIAMVFPDIKCTVLELPYVVAEAPNDAVNGLCFVAGDMFEHIPSADAILLKWILHDWDDDNCVSILRQCKKAIAHGGTGRKVVIIDIVVESRTNDDVLCQETQVLCDLYIMNMANGGVEREEHEWRRIFVEAGFSDYKITPIHGIRSVIEVYP